MLLSDLKMPSLSDDNKNLSVLLAINFTRDFIWTYASYERLNILFNQSSDVSYNLTSQQLGQFGYSMLGMLLIDVSIMLIARLSQKPKGDNEASVSRARSFWLPACMTYTIAAGISVFSWDFAQQMGIYVMQMLLPPLGAAYASAIFAGIAEGFTQALFISIIDKLLAKIITQETSSLTEQRNTQDHIETQPSKSYLKQELPPLIIYGVTIGIIPGSIWQLVFTAAISANFDVFSTSILVATSVGIANLAVGKIQEPIMDRVCCCFFSPLATRPTSAVPPSRTKLRSQGRGRLPTGSLQRPLLPLEAEGTRAYHTTPT